MQRAVCVAFALPLSLAVPAAADQLPIIVDGRFDDWTSAGTSDPRGDDGSSGIDLLEVWAADDADHLGVVHAGSVSQCIGNARLTGG